MVDDRRSQEKPRARIDFLDGVRGAASFMVVVGHSLEAADFENDGGQLFINLGRIGIIAFFLVSGYVVGLSLAHQTLKTFWVRRFFRLFPVYWLCVLAYILINWPVWDERYTFDFLTILANILMIQGFVGIASFLWPTWTLGNELVFYGQQSLASRWVRPTLSVHFGWLWLGLFAALAFLTRFTTRDFSAIAPLVLFTASVGLSIYLWDSQRSKSWVGLTIGFVFAVPLLGVVLHGDTSAFPGSVWTAWNFDSSYLIGGALFLAFYLLRRKRMPRILLWLGDISYELYLVHAIVLLGLLRLGIGGIPLLVLTPPLALLGAWIVRKFVGRPMQDLGRRVSLARRGQPTTNQANGSHHGSS